MKSWAGGAKGSRLQAQICEVVVVSKPKMKQVAGLGYRVVRCGGSGQVASCQVHEFGGTVLQVLKYIW